MFKNYNNLEIILLGIITALLFQIKFNNDFLIVILFWLWF